MARQRLAIVHAAALTLLSAGACGGGEGDGTPQPAANSGGAGASAAGASGKEGTSGAAASGKGGAGAAGKPAAGASGQAGTSPAGAGGEAGAGASGAGGSGAGGATAGAGGASGGAGGGGGAVGGSSGGPGGSNGGGGASGAAGAAPYPHDPIVLVHGYAVQSSWWDPAVAYFVAQGYPASHVRAIEFTDTIGPTAAQAKELAAFVLQVEKELGVTKVDLLSHSMGGLTARMYLKFEGGHEHVRDYVSFGGAHHGTSTACATLGGGALDMCPIYSDKDTSTQWKLNGDPDMDDVDETPFGVEDGGTVHYNSFWSDGDLILSPNETACLNQKVRNDCSDPVNKPYKGILHSQMNSHPQMLADALVLFRAHGP